MSEKRTREKGLLVRLSDQERQLLEMLAAATGLSMNDVVRQAIRAEAQMRGIPVPATRRRRKAP